MPVLGGLISSLFVQLAELFAVYVGRKVAAALAGMAIFASITLALFGAMVGVISVLFIALPSYPAVLTGIWIAIPDNGPACVSTAIAADIALSIYRMNVLNVQFGVYAS